MARFDGRNPRAERQAREFSGTLITEVIEDQVEGVRGAIREGIKSGRNPRQTALDIVGRVNRTNGRREGGVLGIHSRQMQAVSKLRSELASPALQQNYFARELRDRRYDAIVHKAMEAGKPVSRIDIDRITARYADRLLKHRGDVIARTETLRCYNAGRTEGMQQVIDSGKLRADQITQIWDATGDSRTRHTHSSMDGQQQAFGAAFTTPGGHKMLYPGDTSLGAPGSETIQCRCLMRFKVDRYKGI